MRLVFRVLLLLVVMPSAYCFTYYVPFGFIAVLLDEQLWVRFRFVHIIAALSCAVVVGWFIWSKFESAGDNPILCMIYCAIVLGSIGFSAGFFGPIVFFPQNNQGPLLGIIFTGPLGFMLGAVGGIVYWVLRRRRLGTRSLTDL